MQSEKTDLPMVDGINLDFALQTELCQGVSICTDSQQQGWGVVGGQTVVVGTPKSDNDRALISWFPFPRAFGAHGTAHV